MRHSLLVLIAVSVLMTGTAAAQDARAVLQAAAKNMGTDTVKTVQITGAGVTMAIGQNYTPNVDWPRFEVPSYTRAIDFDARFSREELTRRQGNNPPRGGGGTPLQGEQRQIFLANGNYAWNMQGTTANATTDAELRQLDILLTPHGFMKAALAATPTARTLWGLPGRSDGLFEGQKATHIQFTALGKYVVNGMINDQNELERVQTWVPNPIYGALVYEHRYSGYKDFGGAKYPTVLHSHQGDLGDEWMEIRVTNVQFNGSVAATPVPDNVRQAAAQPVRAEGQQLANGVWLIGGGSHHSVAVEFRNFVALVEAPQNERRSLAVIAEVQRLVPTKPIQYVVNTHHHHDHSGGLRTFAALGTTVVTHEANLDWYQKVLFSHAPRTMEPDLLSTTFPIIRWQRGESILPDIQPVGGKYVISDGTRTMDVYAMAGVNHAATMLMVYLPAEKMLVNADMYSPPAAGAAAPTPNASMIALRRNIQRLKLDVAQHVPIHGRVGTMAEFVKIMGTEGTN